MSTEDEEEIERKVDGDAEGDPANMRAGPDLPEPEGSTVHARESAVGGFLMDMDVNGATVARLSLAVFLFGGLVLAFVGAGLWVEEALGTYPFWIVTGVGSMVLSYVLAQVYARRGWI